MLPDLEIFRILLTRELDKTFRLFLARFEN